MKFNGKNVEIGKNVVLGTNVKIGDNTILYDNVIIGNNTIICNNCVIGEPKVNYYFEENYFNPPTEIGEDSLIRSHSILYAGSSFGENLSTGHRITVRENTIAGAHCMFGSYSDIQGNCKIGNYNRFHSYVNIGQESELGDYVFIYPFVVLTNDPTPPSATIRGVQIGDFSIITTAVIMLPGSSVGKHCLVASNSTVGGNFADDCFISGSPAKLFGTLSKMPFFNEQHKKHYPWPNNFERGMPWEGIGFEKWIK